ncbi:MAG: hypothetical protein CMI31_15135 [Opitutae bacterium]|nr:hypothetical protein [Opitutae bacterium]|tara:strand:+ start:664 stop:1380 length:717 start_codon:yes stop_codon:yes gene_type:complete
MKTEFEFTFENLKKQYQLALDGGYEFLTCTEYVLGKNNLGPFTVVNRVDIDFSCKKAERLLEIFTELGVRATFFVRLHAPEYNPFSFENYRILKAIRDKGHEIGYHSEVVDQEAIWNEPAEMCLKRDLDILKSMLGIEVKGVASHGGTTGLNNLDFWKSRDASEFGLLYEAYDESPSFNLFNESFYLSDSEWTQWKCYQKGKLVEGDRRSLSEHLPDKHSLIYFLIHSDTYFDRHFYE